MRKGRLCVIMAAGLFGTEVWAERSPAILVDATSRYRHWETVYTNAVPLSWDWNTNAVRASLTVVGMNGTSVTNFASGISNGVWRIFPTDAPSDEDICDVTLTLYNGADAVVGVLTSRLAVVAGAFRSATLNAVGDSSDWSRVRKNVVLPYDAAWSDAGTNAVSSRLAITKRDGAVQTNAVADVAGYVGWKLRNGGWGYGTFDLSLTFVGLTNEWTATLIRPLDGTMIRMQ